MPDMQNDGKQASLSFTGERTEAEVRCPSAAPCPTQSTGRQGSWTGQLAISRYSLL